MDSRVTPRQATNGDGSAVVVKASGNERVLAALRTGPKTASYLYSLGLIAHSRVASCRANGYDIRCERIPGETGARAYVYKLVEEASEPGRSVEPAPEASGACLETSDVTGRPGSLTSFEPEQLTLGVAA